MFSGAIYGVPGPANRNTYYFATGEADNSVDSFYGSGVYMTTDAGQTWTLVSGQETQTVEVTGTAGTFQLTFNGQSTAAGALAYNATAAQVQTALGGLTTINGVANVNVAQNSYHEVQQIWVNATGGDFQITFNGSITPAGAMVFNASTATVSTVLNALGTISAVGGVTVVKDGNGGDNNYLVTFNTAGTQLLMVGSSDTGTPLTPAGSFARVLEEQRGGFSYDITFQGTLAGTQENLITATAAGAPQSPRPRS